VKVYSLTFAIFCPRALKSAQDPKD